MSNYSIKINVDKLEVVPSPTPSPTPTPTPSNGYVPPEYNQIVLDDSPVHYWRMESETGGVVEDVVGTNDATIFSSGLGSNPTTLTPNGISGNGATIEIDPVEAYQDSNSGFQLTSNIDTSLFVNGYTVEGWIKIPSNTGPGEYYAILGSANNNFGLELYYPGPAASDIELYLWSTGDTTNTVYNDPNEFLDEWLHIVYTISPTSDYIIYVNGQQVDQGTYLEDLVFGYIGTDAGSERNNCELDEIAIYDYVLTAPQISAHYAAAQASLPPPSPTPTPTVFMFESLPTLTHTRLNSGDVLEYIAAQNFNDEWGMWKFNVYNGYDYLDAKYVASQDKIISLLGIARGGWGGSGEFEGQFYENLTVPYTNYYGDNAQYNQDLPPKTTPGEIVNPQYRLSYVSVDASNSIVDSYEVPVLNPFPTPSVQVTDDGNGGTSVFPLGQKMDIPINAKFLNGKLVDGPVPTPYSPPTATPTRTPVPTPTVTPTTSGTPAVTPTPTSSGVPVTPTPTPTVTAAVTGTPQPTPTPTPSEAVGLISGIFTIGYDNKGQAGDGAGVTADGQFVPVIAWSETDTVKSLRNVESCATITIIFDNSLYSWGENISGNTGTGTAVGDVFTATEIGSAEPSWQKVAGGDSERFALSSTGKLYAWGENSSSRLGLGGVIDEASPVQIGTDTNWSDINSAGYFSFAIKSDGTLWSWGANTFGQLAQGAVGTISVPTQVGSATNWTGVYTSWNSGCVFAINSLGELYSCGANFNGILGLGDTSSRNTLQRVGAATDWQEIFVCEYSNTVFGKAASGLYAWGSGNTYGMLGISGAPSSVSTPTLIDANNDWVKVVSTQEAVLGLRSNGELYGWGYNLRYLLSPAGAPDNNTIVDVPTLIVAPEPFLDVTCQTFHTMAYATSQNKLYCWGDNIDNSFAPGVGTLVTTPTVLLDYTSEGKQPLIVAQTSLNAVFATKILA